jgi:hypothetical protein
MLAGAWPPAAPELGSLLARVRRREGRTAKPARCSPGLESQRDGRTMTANRRWQRGSEVVLLELGEEGRRVGMGAARTGRGPQPL